MKSTISIAIIAAFLSWTVSAYAGVKSNVPVQPLSSSTTPSQIEVNATAARELKADYELSWVWFGGKVTNRTSKPIKFKLQIYFVDANGSELGSETLSGTAAAGAAVTIPESRSVMATSAVRQIYGARYVLTYR